MVIALTRFHIPKTMSAYAFLVILVLFLAVFGQQSGSGKSMR